MKSKQVKEAKDKKAVFTARFSKENMKAKWFFKRDVSRNHSPSCICHRYSGVHSTT